MIKISNTLFDREKMDALLTCETKLILDYLIKHDQEKITLRDIKDAFPDIEKMDRRIDDFVSYNILKRHHGVYSFPGVIVTEDLQLSLIELVNNYLKSHSLRLSSLIKNELELVSKENRLINVLITLFKSDIEGKDSIYPNNAISKEWLALPTRYTEVAGKKNIFISMASQELNYDHNLSDFFNFLSLNREDLPVQFLETRRRIGDVNPTYFLNYCERKLRRLEKGKIISNEKSDIFMETLFDMQYCLLEENQYVYNLAHVKTEGLESFKKVQSELLETTQSILLDESEKKFIVSVLLFQWLVTQKIIDSTQTCHGVL